MSCTQSIKPSVSWPVVWVTSPARSEPPEREVCYFLISQRRIEYYQNISDFLLDLSSILNLLPHAGSNTGNNGNNALLGLLGGITNGTSLHSAIEIMQLLNSVHTLEGDITSIPHDVLHAINQTVSILTGSLSNLTSQVGTTGKRGTIHSNIKYPWYFILIDSCSSRLDFNFEFVDTRYLWYAHQLVEPTPNNSAKHSKLQRSRQLDQGHCKQQRNCPR